jgi:hypothetical protein
MSQVSLNPKLSFNAPPRIGATIQPHAYAVLKIPEALSLRRGFSPIPSFSCTAAMISERRGTKINPTATPRVATPAIHTPSLLIYTVLRKHKYGGSCTYSGKPNVYEGPNKKSAPPHIRNAIYVTYFLWITLQSSPTNGEAKAKQKAPRANM